MAGGEQAPDSPFVLQTKVASRMPQGKDQRPCRSTDYAGDASFPKPAKEEDLSIDF
jgi:hypothetical protein